MAQSLSPECTPLKHAYDSCFNSWFEGYLEPAVAHSKNLSEGQRNEYTKEKAEEFERNCGAVWRQYKGCVQKALKDRGLDELLEHARLDNPLRKPPPPPATSPGLSL
ncbi:hypothetical protein SCLCIDRAFT_17698 [Scleroderma citrinum Foug A]|uniref:Mitochondrial distribution and morphology protein 35 n=1 Tax=Scleroderma citrinum Foug A TaxID=1036808 RepID=A0A0C3DD81_9AGAM|nr:hypothetical protein SCLCIDRAFT_17698 [Scleroderma citrinum Foug A]